jgi:uncharacterized repeat protein (TIGR01451 family)
MLILCAVFLCVGTASAQSQIAAPDVVLSVGGTDTSMVQIGGLNNLTGMNFTLNFNDTLVNIDDIYVNGTVDVEDITVVRGTGKWTVSLTFSNETVVELSPVVDMDFTATQQPGFENLTLTGLSWMNETLSDMSFDVVTDGSITVVGVAEDADLGLTKEYAEGTYEIGDTVTWTVTLTNNGPADATNITVVDDATGLTNLTDVTFINADLSSFDEANLTWLISNLASGNSTILKILTTFDAAGEKTNVASITGADQTDPNGQNDMASATVTIMEEVVEGADCAIAKAYSAGTYYPGDTVPWVVTVTNNGPMDATNISVIENPENLTNLTSVEFNVPAGTTLDAPNLTWMIPALNANESVMLGINTSFDLSGDKMNSVAITAVDQTDPNGQNDMASATVTIMEEVVLGADLAISKEYVNETYYVGDFIVWTVTLVNNGPMDATNITVIENPENLTNLISVEFNVPAGTTLDAPNLTWMIPALNANDSVMLGINTSFDGRGEKINNVSITAADQTDPDTANNADKAKVIVYLEPDDYISLAEGWNFISVPKHLAPEDNTASIFEDVDTAGKSILTFDPVSGWTPLSANDTVDVLEGIWIYSNESAEVPLYYDTNPLYVPATKTLAAGWNAIGYSATVSVPAKTAMSSVDGLWSTIIGWDAEEKEFELAIISGASEPFDDDRDLNPKEGYWVFMREEGTLAALSA